MYRQLCAAGVLAVFCTMAQYRSAAAQNLAQAWNWCVNKDHASPDLQIGGCTAVIRSGRLTGEKLSGAFNRRGNGYFLKRDLDRAIGDYDRAIQLDPRNAFAFHDRGLVHSDKHEYDKAISDFSRAIQINPKYPAAFNDRGVAYHAKGDEDRAIADFDEAIKLQPRFTIAIGNRYRIKVGAAASDMTSDGASLQAFRDAFEKVQTGYVTKVDDWKLVQGAIDGLMKAPGIQASAIDEQQLCEKELKVRTATSALMCLGSVFDRASKTAAEKLPPGNLIDSAINGMMGALDPHSSYMNAAGCLGRSRR